MSLKEQVYSVLVVSASEKLNASLAALFPLPLFDPVNVASGISQAKRAISERPYDVIVVNSPLPDGSGVSFALDTATRPDTVVLLLARGEQYDDLTGTLSSNGVFMLRKPVPRPIFEAATGWLVSAREMLRKTGIQSLSIEEKMAEIRLVNRAKWLLISKKGMTEPEAHRAIEKAAMDRCVSKRVIAGEIINELSP